MTMHLTIVKPGRWIMMMENTNLELRPLKRERLKFGISLCLFLQDSEPFTFPDAEDDDISERVDDYLF
ncbi:hypothetical protein RND71_007180 [Anisodus tanguticus]|uniref:Uncharacterized protein n=1 Tax=Anisodus tanguticus TaxID=243964 RepID=A0AAE1SN85_9SOLA|nr:hypothetical protein RND71_007180 [Anisodus tanguticus]